MGRPRKGHLPPVGEFTPKDVPRWLLELFPGEKLGRAQVAEVVNAARRQPMPFVAGNLTMLRKLAANARAAAQEGRCFARCKAHVASSSDTEATAALFDAFPAYVLALSEPFGEVEEFDWLREGLFKLFTRRAYDGFPSPGRGRPRATGAAAAVEHLTQGFSFLPDGRRRTNRRSQTQAIKEVAAAAKLSPKAVSSAVMRRKRLGKSSTG